MSQTSFVAQHEFAKLFPEALPASNPVVHRLREGRVLVLSADVPTRFCEEGSVGLVFFRNEAERLADRLDQILGRPRREKLT